MNTFTANSQESAIVNGIWTLFQGLSQDTKKILLIKLNESIPSKVNKKKKMTKEEASRYLDSLTVRGGEPIPPDENGLDAMIEIKHLI